MQPQHTWDYRVLEHDGFFAVHEVYYTDGQAHTCTVDPVAVAGNDADDLRNELAHMAEAFTKPFLKYSDFVPANTAAAVEDANANTAAFRLDPRG